MIKDIYEGVMTMSYPKENINKKIEIIKRTKWNSGGEK